MKASEGRRAEAAKAYGIYEHEKFHNEAQTMRIPVERRRKEEWIRGLYLLGAVALATGMLSTVVFIALAVN